MRILFVAGGSLATAFALTPLALAARGAGHQVVMAANDDVVPAITGAGLPAVSVCSSPISEFIYRERSGRPARIPADPAEQIRFTGRWFARMAAAWLPPLRAVARDWRPDLVVGGTLSYAGHLLALHLGVPYVRHAWDAIEGTGADEGAVGELAPELSDLGLGALPDPDLFVDVCPPSLRPAEPHPARRTTAMRWIPVNSQQRLEPWMYARNGRPRICLTTGSRVRHDVDEGDFRRHAYDLLRSLAGRLRDLDAEVVVAVPEAPAAALRAEVPGVRAGWVPLDVVTTTCDLVVHHGGGTTSMTALAAGVPQVIAVQGALPWVGAERVARRGAAVALPDGGAAAEEVVRACEGVLGDRSYTENARGLAAEIAALPAPPAVAGELAALL